MHTCSIAFLLLSSCSRNMSISRFRSEDCLGLRIFTISAKPFEESSKYCPWTKDAQINEENAIMIALK